MLTKEEYIKLYEKYIAGHCSAEELSQLQDYQDKFQLEETIWDEEAMGDKADVKARLYARLHREMQTDNDNQATYWKSMRKWWGYAAAAILLVIGGLYWLVADKDTSFVDKTETIVIAPGGDNAILVLDDGTEVSLNELHLGNVTINGKVWANKAGEGELRYGEMAEGEIRYHTIRTPRGGQYQVILADGTKVWLNASSSIRFPTAFIGTERLVEIEGEVFFDVQKDTEKPFVVKSDNQEITVLGTQFNVMAYPDEEGVKTSLIEGKVAVDIAGSSYTLRPGERSVYDKTKRQVTKETFDPEEILAWQEGYFMFNEESIEHVMRKIARWYDVEVEYKGNMKGKLFSGTVSRFGQVDEVLDMLELTGTVTFKIEGRRILVMG
ncbi:FecR family protein [Sphingobacterium corticibacterium]|uniref:FecR family protein n=1 Tax=Sphingobacterium corticibacterium TaxID=2484746 RepID=A0A4Q6XG40_9SPHI|nr:FecR family protein [Sphingobacterium corticibacterium]RZF58443.1 FecR family protein [Sphingobacterium corticibacterium]